MAHIQNGRNVVRRFATDAYVLNAERIVNPLLRLGQGFRYKTKKLQAILTKDIDNLGKAGQTIQVAPGYFRNYLMPNLLAVPNIDKFALIMKDKFKSHQEEVKEVKDTEADPMIEYEKAAKRLGNSRLSLRRILKSKEELREPVTKDEVVREVAKQLQVQIEAVNLYLPSPITKVGEFEVPLRLPMSIPLPEGKSQWSLKVKTRGA